MTRTRKTVITTLVLSLLAPQAARAQEEPSYSDAPPPVHNETKTPSFADVIAGIVITCGLTGVCGDLFDIAGGASGGGGGSSGGGSSGDRGRYQQDDQPAGGNSGNQLPESPFPFYQPSGGD